MGSYAYKYCMCFTRKFRSPDAQPPPDVRAAHHSISASSDDGLRRFLSEVQGESPADVQRILAMLTTPGGIARLVTRSSAPSPPTLDDFFGFLFSPDLNPPIGSQVLTHSLILHSSHSIARSILEMHSFRFIPGLLLLPTIAILLLHTLFSFHEIYTPVSRSTSNDWRGGEGSME
jgi:hypothetical protein